VLSKEEYQNIYSEFVTECRALFGDKLYDVILFGSHARGDYNEESDIDLMIIVDMDNEEARKYEHDLYHAASEIVMKYDTLIIPMLRTKSDYDFRKVRSFFYQEIEREGVRMNAD
jgi:predicted nucleotidyltransferase